MYNNNMINNVLYDSAHNILLFTAKLKELDYFQVISLYSQ